MPHVGPVLEGRTFFCPHCGALCIRRHLRWFLRAKAMQQHASSAVKSWTGRMQPRLRALSSSTDLKMPD